MAFPCACDAVSAAVLAQRLLFAYSWPQDVMVRVRMGIHTGEPLLLAEGYIGLDVHCAARIMSAGHGGQVLISQATHDLVANNLPVDVSLRDVGEHLLKDLQHSIHLFQVMIPNLPSNFPPLKSLYQAQKGSTTTSELSQQASNLPVAQAQPPTVHALAWSPNRRSIPLAVMIDSSECGSPPQGSHPASIVVIQAQLRGWYGRLMGNTLLPPASMRPSMSGKRCR